MKNAGILLILLGVCLSTVAGKPAFAKFTKYPEKGLCIPTYPYTMIVVAKPDKNHYLVSYGNDVWGDVGSIEMTVPFQMQKMERANIWVEYVKSESVKGSDGFDKVMDFWKSCNPSKKGAPSIVREGRIVIKELNGTRPFCKVFETGLGSCDFDSLKDCKSSVSGSDETCVSRKQEIKKLSRK